MSEVNEVEVAEVAEAPVVEEKKVADTSVSMEEMQEELEKSFQQGPPAEDDPVWENFKKLLEEKTIFEVKVESAVKAGLVAMVEDVRAFIPASKVAATFVEKLEEYKGKKLEVIAITVEPEKKKLVLSARDAIKIKNRAARAEAAAKIKEGDELTGKVDSLKDYGAFIDLGDGVSGLLHVSQISWKRVKTPADVLEVGQEIKAKVIGVKDGKISLSMKALEEAPERAPRKESDRPRRERSEGPSNYSDGSNAGTSLGSLLGGIKF